MSLSVPPKKRPRPAEEGGSSSSSSGDSSEDLRSRVVAALNAAPSGMTQKALGKALQGQASMEAVMNVLQGLMNESRVEVLSTRGQGQETMTVFKVISEELASKLQGLTAEEAAVLNLIEKTGNAGLWVRNLKLSTKLQLTALNKILKKLEKAKLIKAVKSIAFKNRRMYMAFDVEPAKEVTGGIWYSEQALDDDFIDSMREAIVLIMREMGGSASPSRVAGAIRERGISSVPLKPQDVQQLMDTLVADGRLDYAGAAKRRAMLYARAAAAVYRPDGGYAGASKGAGASSSRGDDDNDRGFEEDEDAGDDDEEEEEEEGEDGSAGRPYSLVRGSLSVDHLSGIPCGTCTVQAQCEPGGVVSPETCVYYAKWLEF